MSCNSYTLSGIELGCKDNMGGIKAVWLIDEASVVEASAGTELESLTLADGAKFHAYKFRKGTASMVSTAASDETNGTFSVQTDISLQFNKMESTKRVEIMAMCLGNMKAIVLDNNGKYWLLGYDQPISASAASGESGTAFGDFGGYKVTLTDNSREFPFEIPKEIAEEFEGIK